MATASNLLRLNGHCYSEIFNKLKFSELLVIANTCTQLREEARDHFKVFHRKYSFGDLVGVQIIQAFRIFGEYFEIVNSREFNISLDAYNLRDRFIEATSQYCTGKITTFYLYGFDINDDVIERIQNIIPNLTCFQLKNCYFEPDIVHNIFTTNFLKLNTLILHCASVGYSEDSSNRLFTLRHFFPELKHISFRNTHIVDMSEFFQMNPQITTYEENNGTTEIVRNVVAHLQNIESLKLSFFERVIPFEHIEHLVNLNSLSITSDIFEGVISSNLISLSLQHLHLHLLNLSSATTDITKLVNLNTLRLERCTITIVYVIDICTACGNLTEINAQESCDAFPTFDQLREIVSNGKNLEKLYIHDYYDVQPISFAMFQALVQIVKNRPKKLFISIGNQHCNGILQTFIDTNIEIQYKGIEGN